MNQPSRERSVRHLQALYTVVVGLALTVAITHLIDQQGRLFVRLAVLPYFFAYLFTLVPFYHGALRHLDITYIEDSYAEIRSGALMADWGLLFIESCMLLAMASLLQRPQPFTYSLTALFAFDALWGFLAHLAFSPKTPELRAETKWATVNIVAAVLLIGVIIWLDWIDAPQKPIGTYRWVLILTVSIARTILDYWWCWAYYYPVGKEAGQPRAIDPEN